MTNMRLSTAAVLIAFTLLAGIKPVAAQVALKAEDLIGTWEVVSTRDLTTGEALRGLHDASTGIQWMQFAGSHFIVIAMERGRKVTNPDDFAKLSPEEKVKTNYARVWNDAGEVTFLARGGTYSLEGDTIHQKLAIALSTHIIGVDDVLKIIRLDKSTMVVHKGFPILNPTTTIELTYRRIE